MWSLELDTAPTVSGLSLAQARAHSRLDPSVADADLELKVAAAVAACEGFTGRQLVTATWQLWLETWCEPGIYRMSNVGGPGIIRIPKPPLQSLTSVKYLDENGVEQTLDPSAYVIIAGSGPLAPRAMLAPAYGTTWPTARIQPGSIKIEFEAGYGDDETTVPAELTQGMLLWFGEAYERREEQTIGTIVAKNLRAAEDLWWPYRVDF